jgi:hypothetical protein
LIIYCFFCFFFFFSCNAAYVLQTPFICSAGGSLTSTAVCVPSCIAPYDSLYTSLVKIYSFEESQSSATTTGFSDGSSTNGYASASFATFNSNGVFGNGVSLNGSPNSFLHIPSISLIYHQ